MGSAGLHDTDDFDFDWGETNADGLGRESVSALEKAAMRTWTVCKPWLLR